MSLLCVSLLKCIEKFPRTLNNICIISRHSSSKQVQCDSKKDQADITIPDYLYFHKNFDVSLKHVLVNDMTVIENFISPDEENSILKEIEPYLKRLRYEFDHWDDVSSVQYVII
jgi:hypothetical protein